MHICNDWCRPIDVHIQCLMLPYLVQWLLTFVGANKQQPMSSRRCAHVTTNACRPWTMSYDVGQCVYPINDVAKLKRTCHTWSLQALADVDAIGRPRFHMRTCYVRCMQSMADDSWLMFTYNVLMHACVRWCLLTLADIIFHIRICYAQCVQAMTLSSSFCWCAQVMTYVAQLMCTRHKWCLHALVDVILHWLVRVLHEWCCPVNAYTPHVKLARIGYFWCHWKTLFPTGSHDTSDACIK